YADTLIRADFDLDRSADGVIWVKQVDSPEAYGVVKLNPDNEIVELVEKPQEFVSDLAVIGIYYFKEVGVLREELQAVLDRNITHGGEYQINDGIKGMMQKGMKFVPGKVDQWMDCGNKAITVQTNQRMLGFLEKEGEDLVDPSVILDNAHIIAPCFIGEGVVLKNTTVCPYVSVGARSVLENATVKNSIIQGDSKIYNANLDNAMIGNHEHLNGNIESISLGDYSVME